MTHRFSTSLFLPHPVRFGVLLGVFVLPFASVTPARAQTLPNTLTLSAGDYQEIVPADTIARFVPIRTVSALDPQWRSEIEDTETCPSRLPFCDAFQSRATRQHTRIRLESTPDAAAVGDFVTAFATRSDHDPIDATFRVDSGEVRADRQAVPGVALRRPESAALLLHALQTETSSQPLTLALPVDYSAPRITADLLTKLGHAEQIGEGHTDFHGSPKNRIFNINRALDQFRGVFIAPGEEFSFVEHLGPVDGEHGYLPELVIKDNKTEPEFGGGICQVSSTVFRAAIYSGMKVTARRNHAYPVRYYTPYGLDATVYIPKPDLRFINNTPGYVLMDPVVSGTTLTFRFYGTRDGRTVTIDGPHILESHPDGSMKTTFTQTVTDASGGVVVNDSFPSSYKSPALFPHPGDVPLTKKPDNWTAQQWKDYQKLHS